MAISMSKKKSRLSKKQHSSAFCCLHSFFEKIFFRIPLAVFLLLLVYLWSSSTTIISGNVVHVCLSSRKLNNLYCLSAGTQPSFGIPIPAINGSSTNAEQGGSNASVSAIINSISMRTTNSIKVKEVADLDTMSSIPGSTGDEVRRDEELEDAYKQVEEQLQLHRSWVSDSRHVSCDGKNGIYVYELPPKFNKGLLAQCGNMIPWVDFCKFFINDALGEPIHALGKGWYDTHQYSLEPIFHARIMNHPCRVYDHKNAKLFYVPYYGGLDILRWHFKNVSDDVKDTLSLEIVRWLESQGPWYRNLGKDHVFVLGKISWDFRRKEDSKWGTRLLELDEMQNPIKLLIERQPWHVNDIGIPHPTYFHPRTDDDIFTWQLKIIKLARKNLISFAGAPRPNSPNRIRSVLIDQCISRAECKFLNCTSGECDQPESIIGLFTESEFCLQPPGDSPTRKSVFDSLLSGCIPVVFDPFTAYYQYPWHLPEDRDKYSVFIDKEELKSKSVDVVERLKQIPVREREGMRRYIVYELLPGLVYGDPSSKFDKFQDAFSVTINNLLQRVNKLNDL